MLGCLLAGTATAQTTVKRQYTEKLLCPMPPEAYDSTVISPDGRRIAYLVQAGQQRAAVIDGQQGKAYDRVGALTFSPDSQWYAYAARENNQWHIVVNGREQPGCAKIGRPTFSPNSKRLAYVALPAGGEKVQVIQLPGGPSEAYDRVFEGQIVFSPDSQQIAYGMCKGEKWYVVHDAQQYGPYDFLGTLTGLQFSADSKHLGFAALIDKQWCAVVDGKPQKLYENLGNLAFSADGQHVAYAAMEDGKWHVIVDGEPQAAYDAVGEDSLQFSPDGARLAYAAMAEGRWHAVVDGEQGRAFDGISQMLFSPDSKHLAYISQVGTAEMVVLDDRDGRVFDRVGGGTLVFTPGGSRLGYVARSGRASFVVVDAVRKPRYDMVGYLTFTPDGRHYVYAATKDTEAFTVVDDQEAAHRYEAIWTVPDARLIFDAQKKYHYLGLKEGNLYLVEEETD